MIFFHIKFDSSSYGNDKYNVDFLGVAADIHVVNTN
jgi:hypothetical protein